MSDAWNIVTVLYELTDEHDLVREEAYMEIHDRLLSEGLASGLGATVIPELVAIVARGENGAGRAASLLLEIIIEARRSGDREALLAASVLDPTSRVCLDSRLQAAMRTLFAIRDGAPLPDERELDAIHDRLIEHDSVSKEPTERDVERWCKGALSVGDWSPDVVVRFLVDVALNGFGDRAQEIEPLARAAISPSSTESPAGRVLDAAHRTLFHAVLARRLGRAVLFPAGFGSHREEQWAVAQWVFAVEDRNEAELTSCLLSILGCHDVRELRLREESLEMQEPNFPEGDAM